jgi:hypothetical protein
MVNQNFFDFYKSAMMRKIECTEISQRKPQASLQTMFLTEHWFIELKYVQDKRFLFQIPVACYDIYPALDNNYAITAFNILFERCYMVIQG